MLRHPLWLLFCLLWLLCACTAEAIQVSCKPGVWTTYTSDDGLGGNQVDAIAVAPNGAVWVSAGPLGSDIEFGYEKLSRFDGITWSTYLTSDIWVPVFDTITIEPTGDVWVEVGGGVSRFNGRTWKTYTAQDGLEGAYINAMAAAPDGSIWFSHEKGISRFNRIWTTHNPPIPIDSRSMSVGSDGTLWVGAYGHGVFHYDGHNWTHYNTEDGLPNNHVTAIAVASNGTVWAGTQETGLCRFDGSVWRIYTTADGLASNHITAIGVASDDTIWVGTVSGVSRFDEQNWVTYTTADGLPDDWITCIAAASDNSVWVGTNNGGIACYLPPN